jgi:hypothetical protein
MGPQRHNTSVGVNAPFPPLCRRAPSKMEALLRRHLHTTVCFVGPRTAIHPGVMPIPPPHPPALPYLLHMSTPLRALVPMPPASKIPSTVCSWDHHPLFLQLCLNRSEMWPLYFCRGVRTECA